MELPDLAMDSPGSTGRIRSGTTGWLSPERGPQSLAAPSICFHGVVVSCDFNEMIDIFNCLEGLV